MSCVTNDGDTLDDGDSLLDGISSLFVDDTQPPPIPMAAYAAVSVQAHVPIKLELRSSNYTKWSSFFEAMCGKFGLLSHINSAPPPDPRTDAWNEADCAVRSWLYGSVTEDVLDFTMAANQTARDLWVAISNHFQTNKAPRAIFLSHAFHAITQGDMSVHEYAQALKKAADALRDVGKPVADSEMVLALLAGADSRYSTTGEIIAGDATMTFSRAVDRLALQELRLANQSKVAASSAMIASSSAGCGPSCQSASSSTSVTQQRPPQQQQRPPQQGGQQQQRRRRGRRSNGGQQQQRQSPRTPNPSGPWVCINPWAAFQGAQGSSNGAQFQRGGQGILGAPPQAHAAITSPQAPTQSPSWDQAGLIAALQQMALEGNAWVMDTGASTHMHSSEGILLSRLPAASSSITVGNGAHIPVTSRGSSVLATDTSRFILNNVLIVPSIIRNLLSVRQFTRDNRCSIEFDASGFSVKDIRTGRVILRCDSTGDLYTIPSVAPAAAKAMLAASSSLWHRRLGHPGPAVLATLKQNNLVSCKKVDRSLCHACQLGKHVRLPFATSTSQTTSPFEIVHCDVWTSPVASISGCSYYLVLLDDFSHYCWTFPLKHKSDVHQHIVDFIAYARTQFGLPVKCFQADNGTEFVNHAMHTTLRANGVVFHLSCPYTSPQNGKAERILRTLNNSV